MDLSIRTHMGKIIRAPLRLIPPSLRVPILCQPLRGKKWIAGSGPHGFWLGIAEKDKRIHFTNNLHLNDVVYDIGANVGFYSMLSAAVSNRPVYAFEPSPRNYEYLLKHIEMNGFDTIKPFMLAVGDFDGTASFDADCDPVAQRISPSGSLNVEVCQLDTAVKKYGLLAPSIIKIDVEGHELEVLKGAVQLLQDYKPKLYIETHDRFNPGVHDRCLEFLHDHGYEHKILDWEATEVYASPRLH